MLNHQPLLVGHRGAPLLAPENTMASFVAAREGGAGGVELDVHRSRDGRLVVHHDYLLDRTTTGHGPIFGHDWDDLAPLDAGSWFSPAFETERVPRLEEVLELEDLEFEIELKGYDETIVDEVLRAVETADRLAEVEFTSGNVPLLAELRTRRPEARTGLFTPRWEPWMTAEVHRHIVVGLAQYSTCQVVHVNAQHLTAELVDELRALGKIVHANDARSPADVERAAHLGVDRLSADDVAMASAALGKR